MERTRSIFYEIDGIPVEEYNYKSTGGDWVNAIRHNEGITDNSVKLVDLLQKSFSKFTYAAVDKWEEDDRPYLMLRDDHGHELYLTGCSSGYPGTGPHGTLEVLKKLGFDVDEIFVFCSEAFKINHPSTGKHTS